MITRSQKKAFVVAQAQPSASNRPNSGAAAHRRDRPGSAFAIAYSTVSVPVIAGIGWTEQMNG